MGAASSFNRNQQPPSRPPLPEENKEETEKQRLRQRIVELRKHVPKEYSAWSYGKSVDFKKALEVANKAEAGKKTAIVALRTAVRTLESFYS